MKEHTVEEECPEWQIAIASIVAGAKTNGTSVNETTRQILEVVTSLHHSHTEEVEQARSAGVNDGYKLAVKHLKEAYEHNKNTTTLEAIEWLADNARLITPNTHST